MSEEKENSTKSPFYGERIIKSSELICFENPNKKRPYEITIELPEFTCKCPFSGYPDFGVIYIRYQPNNKVIELKSIKLYINSYRDLHISHEEVANKIFDDFLNATKPNWAELNFDFNPRGNVKMSILLSHGNKASL